MTTKNERRNQDLAELQKVEQHNIYFRPKNTRMFSLLRSVRPPRSRLLGVLIQVSPRTASVAPTSHNFRTFSFLKSNAKAEAEPEVTTSAATEETATFLKKKATKKLVEDLPVDFSDISRANVAIRGGVKRTQSVKSVFLSEIIGANVYLKPEFQQFTGSFKERGARNAILSLMREKGKDLKGVIAASAGNHALALAYHGKDLGVPVTVVMPVVAPLAKVDKCRVGWIFKKSVELVRKYHSIIYLVSCNLITTFCLRCLPLSEIRRYRYY